MSKKSKRNQKRQKRNAQNSGTSSDKRQRLSGDTSESGETKSSEALPVIPLPVITLRSKEEMAADRERQRCAELAESLSPPCIAVLYKQIKRKWVKDKGWVKGQYIKFGDPITFTSRLKASECFGGMNLKTIGSNIDNKGRSKIKGGKYDGLFVMLSDKPVESIMFGGKEIKPAPARSERVKGHLYVYNGIVRICGGGAQWKCTEHNIRLQYCGECGGASICDHEKIRIKCRICRVQPLHQCTECPQTCTSAVDLEIHMRIHTGEKPNHCELCTYKSAQRSGLTVHEGWTHDIGNEECTNCHKNCYRPRSWIDPETNEYERSCKKCYQDRFGVNIREEQEWSDWLDKRFYPEFRTCSDTRISMCTLFRPDGLYEFEGPMVLHFDHLILHWEFDEHQHCRKAYSGDENRMLQMHGIEKHKDKQWVTVRVNPHAYTHPARKAKPGKEERKELMLKVMKACLTKKWDTKIHVVYLFYSETNGNITQRINKTMLYDAEDVDKFCK